MNKYIIHVILLLATLMLSVLVVSGINFEESFSIGVSGIIPLNMLLIAMVIILVNPNFVSKDNISSII